MAQAWFRVKRYGYGVGLPIAWQGWAVLGGFATALGAGAWLLMPRHPGLWVAWALLLGLALTGVSARRSDRRWRWRWGDRA